jgi:HEAT repeats
MVAEVLKKINSPEHAWIRENAAFVLGNIRAHEQIDVLFELASDWQTTEHVAVAHAALFAIGDIGFRSEDVLQQLMPLVDQSDAPTEVRRAATYALATLRPETHLDPLADQQLKSLQKVKETDADRLTRSLASWGWENINRWLTFKNNSHATELWGVQQLSPDTPGCF